MSQRYPDDAGPSSGAYADGRSGASAADRREARGAVAPTSDPCASPRYA